MQKVGIANLTILTMGVGELATVGGKVFENGRVDLGDIMHLRSAMSALKKFTDVDYKALWPEAKDIDAEEAEALSSLFEEVFDLPPALDSVESIVEAGLAYLLDFVDLLMRIFNRADGQLRLKSA